MRSVSLLLVASTLLGCSTYPPAPRSPSSEAHLQSLLAGKVAGAPVNCMPSTAKDNMIVIDDNTIVFRDGSRLWRNDVHGSCSGLRMGGTLVTKSMPGTSSLCRGDIGHVLTSGGMITSSCVLGDFVPYTTAGR
jgi:hypothetical protein